VVASFTCSSQKEACLDFRPWLKDRQGQLKENYVKEECNCGKCKVIIFWGQGDVMLCVDEHEQCVTVSQSATYQLSVSWQLCAL